MSGGQLLPAAWHRKKMFDKSCSSLTHVGPKTTSQMTPVVQSECDTWRGGSCPSSWARRMQPVCGLLDPGLN